MQPTGLNNQNAFVQTYSSLFKGNIPKNNTAGILVATATAEYKTGTIMAQFNTGANAGLWTYYDSTGADGQDVAAGILWDDSVPYEPMTENYAFARIALPSGGVQAFFDKLSTHTPADLNETTLNSMGGKITIEGDYKVVTFN